MRSAAAAFVTAALMTSATPALATGSASCRGTINPEITLDLVIGHMVGPVIAQARFGDGTVTGDGGATIAQSWLDAQALHVDIVDANGSQYIARLRTTRPSERGQYAGTLRYGGRQYQVRCRVEG
ncbi:hypothetical protein [Sphingosinicella sp. YJ22]|uniref:hypothetical protein n=1 Tax=Sphingosinicella sp. YJ22 TaxID=1104780 RepID=UPI001409CC59|nr:hypothetical protein [Sphingosinicella sp. YJ22]